MAALMGALIGFLFYNFNPARIFMGDSGSYFLGYVLATSSLLAPMQKTSTTVALLVPMVALGVPIFDTLFSIVRRYFERRPVFSPDRGHIHHRLLEMGVTHRRAVLTLYGVSVTLAASAVAIALGRDWEVGFAILGASIVLIGLVRFVGYFQYTHARLRRRERFYDTQVQLLRRLMPDLYHRLHSARDEGQITRTLGWLGEQLESCSVRLEDATGTAKLFWADSTNSEPSRRSNLRASFDAGTTGLRLVFAYQSDVALSSQAEVLLQIIADEVHRCLVAVGSELVEMEAEASLVPPAPSIALRSRPAN
jgi:UDP-GlcNAc:undecaprenyl-phosphate GlcNAc-1-phosphate transferase